MGVLIFNILFSIYVLIDVLKRKGNILWFIGVLILGVLILPFYFAYRPLKDGDTREGGKAWNVLKNFALFWTIVMIFATISAFINIGEEAQNLQGGAEEIGFAIGATLGFGILGALWFFPMIGAIIIGVFVKKSTIVETGPTGKLAELSKA